MSSVQLQRWLCGALLVSLNGCEPSPAARDTYRPEFPPILVASSEQMQELIETSERPVVVEFGVDIGCARCDEMRSQVAELAQELKGAASVVRVDYNANRQLAAQYGATICPSYVIFQQGQIVSTRTYPTSADMIRIDLSLAQNQSTTETGP